MKHSFVVVSSYAPNHPRARGIVNRFHFSDGGRQYAMLKVDEQRRGGERIVLNELFDDIILRVTTYSPDPIRRPGVSTYPLGLASYQEALARLAENESPAPVTDEAQDIVLDDEDFDYGDDRHEYWKAH